MADRDSCKKWNVWSAPEEKQILLICSELEIAGQLDVCFTSASVSSPILILIYAYFKKCNLAANYAVNHL